MNMKQIVIATIVSALFVLLLFYISNQNNNLNSSAIINPTIIPSIVPTSTSIPSPTIVPTRLPTRQPTNIPSKVPTRLPTSTTQNTTAPTSAPVQSSNNNFYCFINAQAQNEGVPATYNLVCGVGNLGSSTSAEFQWDYNGDGNWDSGFSQSNCSVNYTYTTPGIYNVKMKAKTPDGQTAECTTSVGIQPH